MNSGTAATERSVPRWASEAAPTSPAPSATERQVLGEVLSAMRRIHHGSIQLQLQDGRVVQLDVTERKRL